MAGRIRPEDVARVRERSPISTVIGAHLQLRGAGPDRLKALCPFHDEKTPSFSVNTGLGYFHCFGCGESGDVFDFVRKMEQLTFPEAVEALASRAGVSLTYAHGGAAPRQAQGQRQRLLAAHAAAAEFFIGQLAESAEAGPGRQFLADRGFDEAAVAPYGVGYAPARWDVLTRHLREQGFTDAELLAGGLASQGQRGLIDRFRGRLVWPIRDITGEVIGFGARRLGEDDTGPKYLNTPDTPLYRKSSVLYGVELAKREIARRHQAVVVEGYTDVMACHLAGVPTAVATCGTAFGSEHIGVLRRLLMDQDEFRGEVIFTFDGDEAGRKAALKAFEDDQRFVTQTFVAVEAGGLDPCDLRLAKGDVAVRDLVARRVPLVEFAVRSLLDRYDLEIPEGRVAALAAAAPKVAAIKDRSLRPEYARRLAGWLGMDVETVLGRVAELAGAPQAATAAQRPQRAPQSPPRPARPDPDDPRSSVEREMLKLAVQHPAVVGADFDRLDPETFPTPAYAALRAAVVSAGGAGLGIGGEAWVGRLREAAGDDASRSLVTELAVEPLRSNDPVVRYAGMMLARIQEMAVTRRITQLKSRIQRMNPLEQADDYNRLYGELIALEQHKRELREQAIGAL
ncbi:MAG: DNA primase [Mycobacteriales bacterium]